LKETRYTKKLFIFIRKLKLDKEELKGLIVCLYINGCSSEDCAKLFGSSKEKVINILKAEFVYALQACSKCGRLRNRIKDFYLSEKQKNLVCVDCCKKQKQDYYKENRENVLSNNKQYRIENKEKRKEYDKKYREQNREKLLEYGKKYRKENKEYLLEINRKYYQENKEQLKEYSQNYREEHKEQVAKNKRKYYKENRETFLKHMNNYYKENKKERLQYSNNYYQKNKESRKQYREGKKEKLKEYNQKYILENKEKLANYDKNYKHGPATIQQVQKLSDVEEVLENQIRCKYCGRWMTPTVLQVQNRLKGIQIHDGNYIYCSEECKEACPVFYKRKYPKGFKHSTSREVNPYLRQIVLDRDNYVCQKCGKSQEELSVSLHCHHIIPYINSPIETDDPDNCITLCKNCHKLVHKLPDCGYSQLRCKKN